MRFTYTDEPLETPVGTLDRYPKLNTLSAKTVYEVIRFALIFIDDAKSAKDSTEMTIELNEFLIN